MSRRIAFVHPVFQAWGGAENVLLWLCRSLVARGHAVTVLTGACSPMAHQRLQEAGAEIRILDAMHGKPWERLQLGLGGSGPPVRFAPLADHVVRLDVASMRRGAPRLARILAEFDVVNVHNFPSTWWVAAANEVAAGGLPPVLWLCNEPPRTLYPGLFEGSSPYHLGQPESGMVRHDRATASAFSTILCMSEYVRSRVVEIYGRPDVRCLPLGIPLVEAEEAPAKGRDADTVLMVSRLVAAKNIDTALAALAQVPEVRLRIIGEGPDASRLKALASRLGLEGRAEFLGFLDDSGVREQYRRAAAFLYIPIGEPFGLVLLEAGTAGLPCVTSDHGGPSEIVRHGETGVLVDPVSPERVAEGLRHALSEATRMGEQARRVVQDNYSFEAYVDGYCDALFSGDARG